MDAAEGCIPGCENSSGNAGGKMARQEDAARTFVFQHP